jgi:hypothetical protein
MIGSRKQYRRSISLGATPLAVGLDLSVSCFAHLMSKNSCLFVAERWR